METSASDAELLDASRRRRASWDRLPLFPRLALATAAVAAVSACATATCVPFASAGQAPPPEAMLPAIYFGRHPAFGLLGAAAVGYGLFRVSLAGLPLPDERVSIELSESELPFSRRHVSPVRARPRPGLGAPSPSRRRSASELEADIADGEFSDLISGD